MIQIILLCVISLAIIIVSLWLILPYKVFKTTRKQQEKEAITIITSNHTRYTQQQYRKIQPKDSHLSLIVPSYNEQERLTIMLEQTAEFLLKHKYRYEIIIVNDGSKDRTTEVALATAVRLNIQLVVVQYPKNRGKGAAVRAGVSVAEGKYILMVDADGATKFSDLTKLVQKMKDLQAANKDSLKIIVGSRRVEQQAGKVQRKLHRQLVSFVFKTIISVILGIKTKDTQCGFKLFNKQSAKLLFQIMHINRFAFDVELFFISNHLNVQTAQVGVQWHDVDGSKLTVIDASVNMLRDVLIVRLYYLLNLWKISDRYEVK